MLVGLSVLKRCAMLKSLAIDVSPIQPWMIIGIEGGIRIAGEAALDTMSSKVDMPVAYRLVSPRKWQYDEASSLG